MDHEALALAVWAEKLLAEGRLAAADAVFRDLIRRGPDSAPYRDGLGRIALALGLAEHARLELSRAVELDPSFEPARNNLARAGELASGGAARAADGERFLLIRGWGCGFWSDVDHVLGQLMVAEITGRTAVVHWGPESRFGRPGDGNVWTRYFEPVSATSADELKRRALDVFPGKWKGADLLRDPPNRWAGKDSRLGALYFMNRPEPLVVSDFHTCAPAVLGWTLPGGPLHAATTHRAYRAVVGKYLRPRARLVETVDRFAAERFGDGPIVGVHIRASDKIGEEPELAALLERYPALIDEQLGLLPGARVFLCTDSAEVLASYARRYGSRLIATASKRTRGTTGLHLARDREPHRLGDEVMVDAYLLARCRAFIGLGASNVSCMVTRLRDWPEGAARLLGECVQEKFNPHLYVAGGLGGDGAGPVR